MSRLRDLHWAVGEFAQWLWTIQLWGLRSPCLQCVTPVFTADQCRDLCLIPYRLRLGVEVVTSVHLCEGKVIETTLVQAYMYIYNSLRSAEKWSQLIYLKIA